MVHWAVRESEERHAERQLERTRQAWEEEREQMATSKAERLLSSVQPLAPVDSSEGEADASAALAAARAGSLASCAGFTNNAKARVAAPKRAPKALTAAPAHAAKSKATPPPSNAIEKARAASPPTPAAAIKKNRKPRRHRSCHGGEGGGPAPDRPARPL